MATQTDKRKHGRAIPWKRPFQKPPSYVSPVSLQKKTPLPWNLPSCNNKSELQRPLHLASLIPSTVPGLKNTVEKEGQERSGWVIRVYQEIAFISVTVLAVFDTWTNAWKRARPHAPQRAQHKRRTEPCQIISPYSARAVQT